MIKMICGDCNSYLHSFPDGAFDLAIVDPPYGIGEDAQRSTVAHKTDKWRSATAKEYVLKNWDKEPLADDYFSELFRVSKNQIIWGGNYFSLPPSPCWIFWDKLNGKCDFADGELAWTSFGSSVRKFEYLWNGFQKQRPEKRFHPTQKPVSLYKWLLSRYAKPGDRILDTHGGSGSICIACYDLGFDIVWIEKDKDYFDQAVEWYERHAMQERLFKPEESKKVPKNTDIGF